MKLCKKAGEKFSPASSAYSKLLDFPGQQVGGGIEGEAHLAVSGQAELIVVTIFLAVHTIIERRSEERRVGKEC